VYVSFLCNVLCIVCFFSFVVCKIVTSELEARLEETGKSDDVIQTTYSISDREDPKFKKKYRKS